MKTFYINFDLQCQTECVVKVKAKNEKEALLKGYQAMFAEYDVSADTKKPVDDEVTIIDEDGEEI